MLQRQKIIVIAIAIFVLVMVMYFSGDDNHVVTNSPAVVGKLPADINELLAQNFAKAKECEALHLSKVEAVTEEKYAKMRQKDASPRGPAKRLPPSIEKYKARAAARKDRIFAMNEEQFLRSLLAKAGNCKNNKKKKKRSQGKDKKPDADTEVSVQEDKK